MKTYAHSLFFSIILCHLSKFTNGLPTAVTRPGDYYFIPGTSALYKFHDTYRTFRSAVEICMNEGATLYYADNESEFNSVLAFHLARIENFPREFYVGIKKTDGVFTTITGIPISNVYDGWLTGEPNNEGYEYCVEARNQTVVWGLNDKSCFEDRKFICKIPIEQPSGDSYIDVPTALATAVTKPDYYFIPGTSALYKFHDTYSVWNSAVQICKNEGATLYYADNESEFNYVLAFHLDRIENFPREFYVGIKKTDGVFTTITGIPISNVYNGWLTGEPNNEGNEECVEARNQTVVWGLNDKSCFEDRKFICKIPIEQPRGGSHNEYTYAEPLGKSYKLHLTPKTWHEARAVCQEEDSELAVINSPEEAAYLVRIANSVNYKVPGNFTRGVILLGFYKQNHKDWQTVHGQSLYYSGYACWGNQQPDGGRDEECGAMFYNGHLDDIGCDRKAKFICEHVSNDPNIISEPDPKTLTISACNNII